MKVVVVVVAVVALLLRCQKLPVVQVEPWAPPQVAKVQVVAALAIVLPLPPLNLLQIVNPLPVKLVAKAVHPKRALQPIPAQTPQPLLPIISPVIHLQHHLPHLHRPLPQKMNVETISALVMRLAPLARTTAAAKEKVVAQSNV